MPVDMGYGMGGRIGPGRRFERWLGKRVVIAVRLITARSRPKRWIDNAREQSSCGRKSADVPVQPRNLTGVHATRPGTAHLPTSSSPLSGIGTWGHAPKTGQATRAVKSGAGWRLATSCP